MTVARVRRDTWHLFSKNRVSRSDRVRPASTDMRGHAGVLSADVLLPSSDLSNLVRRDATGQLPPDTFTFVGEIIS
jgi:hypothetical protein